ncbi:alkaline phosphatase [Helicobacter sp. 12S02634-8]|uniref:DedA family protein n=1 Tax=Helicobacter sp. 12S02634-8 TaxID=1476199 RepID=UPI000BD1521A|nr:DedA family protein [Helicobacter sp. 12S02634-8]PAF47498.1 alkaline phosphatase [Helicobacter sp. 12S02634-8]
MSEIITFIIDGVGSLGYFGIFIMMFLESSFFPFPSEVVMIPAGYLAYQGQMNIYIAILFGILGSLCGALFNYYIAWKFGRGIILTYGKYFLFTEKSMLKMENYFKKHGEISTFLGRLIPGVRQYISLPAGLAKMGLVKFCFYSALGAGIWVGILSIFGYYIGVWLGTDISTQNIIETFTAKSLNNDEKSIKTSLHLIVFSTLIVVVIIALAYILYQKRKRK